MHTALIIGATGLVGSNLLTLLIESKDFSKIKIFTRRSTNIIHQKVEEHIIDFDHLENYKELIKGDVLFSTLGTTLKKAGSKEAQYKIDYTYQYEFAKIAAQNHVKTYVLVSSAGASPKSNIFYSRMKGELEEAIKQLAFSKICIIQPGMLIGERAEARPTEAFMAKLVKGISYIPGLRGYKPIQGKEVAQALVNVSLDKDNGIKTYSLGEVFELAKDTKRV